MGEDAVEAFLTENRLPQLYELQTTCVELDLKGEATRAIALLLADERGRKQFMSDNGRLISIINELKNAQLDWFRVNLVKLLQNLALTVEYGIAMIHEAIIPQFCAFLKGSEFSEGLKLATTKTMGLINKTEHGRLVGLEMETHKLLLAVAEGDGIADLKTAAVVAIGSLATDASNNGRPFYRGQDAINKQGGSGRLLAVMSDANSDELQLACSDVVSKMLDHDKTVKQIVKAHGIGVLSFMIASDDASEVVKLNCTRLLSDCLDSKESFLHFEQSG